MNNDRFCIILTKEDRKVIAECLRIIKDKHDFDLTIADLIRSSLKDKLLKLLK